MWTTLPAVLVLSTTAFAASDFSTLIEQGRAAWQRGDVNTAETTFAQACSAVAPPKDEQSATLQVNALCEHELASVAESRGQDDIAEKRYLRALALWQQAGVNSPGPTVTTLTNLGDLYHRQFRLSEADSRLQQARELALNLRPANPELYAIVLSRSGSLYAEMEQPDRAGTLLNQAIAALKLLPKPNAPELAYAWSSLGMLALNRGQYQIGESHLREAVSLANTSLGEDHPETAAYSTNLALALLIQGQHRRAETLLRRARFVVETHLGPDSPQLVNILAELTTVETSLGKFGLAEDCGQKALEILKRTVAPDSAQIALTQVNLAVLYMREQKLPEASAILPQAIASERRLFKNGRTLADGIRHLGSLRARQHSWTEAESLYREALQLYEAKLGPDHPDIAPVLIDYCVVLKHLGASKAQVKGLEARAKTIGNSTTKPQAS